MAQRPENRLLKTFLMGTGLTRCQADVLILLIHGKSNREIADDLNISEVTVKSHLTKLFKLTATKSRAKLMARYMRPIPLSDLMLMASTFQVNNFQ